jgi:hypothetical protein
MLRLPTDGRSGKASSVARTLAALHGVMLGCSRARFRHGRANSGVRMKTRWLVLLLLASPLSRGDEPKLPKGIWRILVKPNARWVLHNTFQKGKSKDTVVVETYDVRKVGAADVARLRWTFHEGKEKRDIGNSDSGKYTQVAVTDAGLYILSADMDDAKIAEALKRKPSRSDPPKPYKGTKQNSGRYLNVDNGDKGPVVCMGFEPPPDAGECESTCDGEMCVSAQAGVVKLEGQWSPDEGIWAQQGWDD